MMLSELIIKLKDILSSGDKFVYVTNLNGRFVANMILKPGENTLYIRGGYNLREVSNILDEIENIEEKHNAK